MYEKQRTNASRMSPAALKRCRSMLIHETDAAGRTLMQVTDPRLGDRVIQTYYAATPMDIERIKRAWCGTYRVPMQNIVMVGEDADEGVDNADSADQGSPAVHEHREEVLDSGKSEPESKAKKRDPIVPKKL